VHGFSALAELLASPVLSLMAVLALSALFGWAGLTKVRHPYLAAMAAFDLRVISRPSKTAGVLIGVGEAALAAGLVVPATRPLAAIASVIVSLAFAVAIGAALRRGERFPCGCFGDPEEAISPQTVWRSGLMALGGIEVALASSDGPFATEVWLQAGTLAAILIGVALALAALERLRGATEELDETLDWEWILQQRHAGLEPETPLVRRLLTGGNQS
jgi:hypothetical protein